MNKAMKYDLVVLIRHTNIRALDQGEEEERDGKVDHPVATVGIAAALYAGT